MQSEQYMQRQTLIHTFLSGIYSQTDRHTASQTVACIQIHSDTCRYMQRVPIQAATRRNRHLQTCTDRGTETDRDRHIQTETDRYRQRQNIDRQIHSDPYRGRHIHTVIHLQRDRYPNRYIHAE